MRGKTGPSMKILPKKLPRNRVTTKYSPRTDTAIWKETKTLLKQNVLGNGRIMMTISNATP